MDGVSSDFPMMGESVLSHVMCSGSAKPGPYTTSVARKTMGTGKSPTGSTGGSKNHTEIHEANGPACHVQHSLYRANAAEASATQRNVRIVPSVVPRQDRKGSAGTFWAKRQYASQGA
jgi:hypothetical protein